MRQASLTKHVSAGGVPIINDNINDAGTRCYLTHTHDNHGVGSGAQIIRAKMQQSKERKGGHPSRKGDPADLGEDQRNGKSFS